MDSLQFNYLGRTWKPCPTEADGNCFFNAVFGTRNGTKQPYRDVFAKSRRMYWSTFLTFQSHGNLTGALLGLLRKCFVANDKYQLKSPKNVNDYTEYIQDITSPDYWVLVEEIPLLAALEKIRIVLFVGGRETPEIIEPDPELLGTFPFRSVEGVREVVICLVDNHFARLAIFKQEHAMSKEIPRSTRTKKYMKKGGGGTGMQGHLYRINLLTMVLLNGLKKFDSWRLSTGDENAGRFDDLIFEVLPSESAILLKAKYSRNTKKKITYNDLLSDNFRHNFSIQKYFFSYQEIQIKNKFKVKNIIICTNLDLHDNTKEYLNQESLNVEGVLHFWGADNICYSFRRDWRKTSLKDNIKLYGLKRSIPGEVTDDDIDDFLAVLKIFPNYLCDKNFDTVVKETISSLPFTTNMDSKTIFQEIHYKMFDWFREERGSYLTEVQAKGFLDDISSDGSNWSVKEKKLHLVLQQQTGSVSSKSEKMPSSTRKKIYSKKGSAGIEGNLYQINVLTVVLLNALTKVDNWRLSTENADAGCFDDLIFEVLPSGSAILLQIRYRKSAHKKITYRELLSDSLKNEFNLSKYFFSYQEIKDKFNVQNIIVCTSMSILDEDAKEYFNREILDAESVLHFTGADNICYSFNDRGSTSLKDDIKLYGWNRHVTDEDIDDFLAVLKFCPNYLRSENFDTVVEETISKLSLSVNMDTKAIFKDIHYKMLDWFNDERGTYLTEIEAKGFFCDIRSNKYCDYLRLYDISFKKKNLPTFLQQRWQIGSDLADAQRISQINPGSELTILNVIKIYQALEPDDLKRALFVNPDDSVDIQQEVVNAFEIPLYTTLVIVCNEALEENAVTEMYDKVTRIINTHFYKHVILIAEENNNLARRFKQSNVDCESITDRITFTDPETITQEIFKQKRCINFQGFMVSIEQLFASWTNHELNQILDSEILAKLARNDEIHVGLELKPLNKYYIHRSFNRDGHNIPEENIYDLDRSTEEKVILISGPAGMGKSTVLASLEFSIKKTNPHLWVVRFDLNTYMDIMEAVLQRGEKCIRMMELLDSHDVSKLESEFEKKLFATPERIVVILDGVDEISPVYTDLVKNLLNDLLLQRNVAKILVTTRPHLCQELEELLNSQSFTLEPFSDQNQIDFLTKYWTKELNLRDDKERTKCRIYTRALIPEMSWWIGDRVGNSFAGIPLQTKMLADVFQQRGGDGVSDWEGCKEFVSSADGSEPKLPERIDLIQLYEMFIDKKREIFIEKSNLGSNLDEVVEENLEKCHSYHRAFALRDIFYSSVWDIFSTNVEWPVPSAFLDNYLLKLGIVQSQAGELHFIHRTFAEYFVATILIEELECEPVSEAFQNFFADHIMLKKEYIVVRAFFDGLIRRALPPLQRKIDDFFNRIAGRIVNSKEFYLHLFAEEGCVAILEVAMHAIESSSVSVDVENGLGETPLHTAARFGHLDAIKCLVKRGAEIRTNKFGQTALHSATCAGNLEIVKYLVSEAGADVTAKDESGTTPLHLAALTDNLEAARFFLDELGADASAENNDGRTALHTAVFEGNLGMVKVCVNQAGADVNIRDGRIRALRAAVCENNFEIVEFLVEKAGADVAATYECGRSVLHLAASAGNLEIVKLLVKRGASAIVRDARGQIPLHAAAFEGNLETVRFLVTLAADVNVEDDDGQTPLRAAASMGKSEIVNFLVDNAGADGNIKGDFITRKKMSFWYSDQRWKQYPTVEDGDSFFHAAFGKTDDNLQPCFDPRAEHRRMHWSTFLTYFEDDTIPSHLKEQLSKCEADQLDGYAEDVMRSEHRIRVEELPILAALMNVRVVLFVRDNEVPEVFESDSHLIENCPLENTAPLVEVVIWFNGVNFVRLQAEKTTARRFKKDPRGKIMEEIIYKINVMTVFLVNGIRKFQNWRLATQREDAGCFDDVIFELSPSETVPTRDTILVQACYNAIKEKITYKNLLEDKIASLRLSQLYFSYMAIKSNYRIKNVVLCTNADLDLMKKLGGLVNRERLNETSIFHYEGVESWCYTFNENIIPALEKSLQRSPRKRERDIISKENIRQFLNHLQIITLYPSNGSFDKIIENLISSVGYIKKLDVKDFSQYLNAKIIDWFEEGRGRHLAEVDAKAIMCGYRSKKFCDKLHDIKINFTTDTLVFDRVKRILHIVPDKEFILNLIKVYWFLYRNKIKTLFVHPDDPIFIQKKMIEALEAPEYTHLVICVDNIMNDDKAIRECCEKITSILTRCIEKRLILIADEDNKFAKHIETENRHLYRMSSDSISFADLTEESQEKFLEDLVTIFEANM